MTWSNKSRTFSGSNPVEPPSTGGCGGMEQDWQVEDDVHLEAELALALHKVLPEGPGNKQLWMPNPLHIQYRAIRLMLLRF